MYCHSIPQDADPVSVKLECCHHLILFAWQESNRIWQSNRFCGAMASASPVERGKPGPRGAVPATLAVGNRGIRTAQPSSVFVEARLRTARLAVEAHVLAHPLNRLPENPYPAAAAHVKTPPSSPVANPSRTPVEKSSLSTFVEADRPGCVRRHGPWQAFASDPHCCSDRSRFLPDSPVVWPSKQLPNLGFPPAVPKLS